MPQNKSSGARAPLSDERRIKPCLILSVELSTSKEVKRWLLEAATKVPLCRSRRSLGVSANSADSFSLPSVHTTTLTGYASHSSGGTTIRTSGGQLYPLAVSTIAKKTISRWAAGLPCPRRDRSPSGALRISFLSSDLQKRSFTGDYTKAPLPVAPAQL